MRKQTKRWTTKDGGKIRICDMDNDHLMNTIKLIQRTCEVQRIKNSVFYATCVGPQGDMAQLAFVQECDAVWQAEWQDYVPDIYNNLEDDATRRGLKIPEQPTRVDIEVDLIAKKVGVR